LQCGFPDLDRLDPNVLATKDQQVEHAIEHRICAGVPSAPARPGHQSVEITAADFIEHRYFPVEDKAPGKLASSPVTSGNQVIASAPPFVLSFTSTVADISCGFNRSN